MEPNPYRISEAALRRSTGHAPEQPLIEEQAELDVPHDLPLRITPMSPASEIAALGQIQRGSGGRVFAMGALAIMSLGIVWQVIQLLR